MLSRGSRLLASRHSRYSRHRAIGACTVAAFLLIVNIAACGEKPPPLPKLAIGDVVLAFGDSLTFGTGATPDETYPKVLGTLINRPVVGSGVPGETSGEGLERLPGVLDEVKPRILLLCLGGNDMLRKMGTAGLESNLRAMVQLARSRGVAVVLIGVPTPELFGSPPELYEKIARDARLPLENKIMREVLYDRSLKSDMIHPNAEGYRRVAQALADLLRRAGAV
ncbi:MAG TPA: arylesterase [Burkholderiales bacterium]|nr:arylesterase [Burkholderiales bacterium]